jgi:hypothetical protein
MTLLAHVICAWPWLARCVCLMRTHSPARVQAVMFAKDDAVVAGDTLADGEKDGMVARGAATMLFNTL